MCTDLPIPNLFYLDRVYSGADTEPAGNIARDLAKRGFVKCPRIKTFVFSYGAEIHLESGLNVSRMVDHEMVAIVQALPKDLEVLLLDYTSFGQLSFCTLRTRPFYATILQGVASGQHFCHGCHGIGLPRDVCRPGQVCRTIDCCG